MKKILLISIALIAAFRVTGQDLPLLKVSEDKRYIVTEDNEPFFWLGGTAWELIHRLTREEIDQYLGNRSGKGFTVIQTVILAELDGLSIPDAYGDKPLIDNDPEKINEKYFELVDYVVEKAGELGMYVGLLPTWGDKFNLKWGAGPVIFTPENAEIYGEILAKRYLKYSNIIWILGGDRVPESDRHYAIIRTMAKGIRNIDSLHLMTYHPVGGKIASAYFMDDDWLDIDMFQSGHSSEAREYAYVSDSRDSKVRRPVINGEARYENIPDRFWSDKYYGWLDDADVRVSAYWSLIAGAAGYTYGCNDIWQMYAINRNPVIQARTGWQAALDLPGSSQMKNMKEIFEILPWQRMVPDQSLILSKNPEDGSHILSAADSDKKFVVAYTPTGKPVKVNMSEIDAEKVKAYWFNPRSGQVKYIGEFDKMIPQEFKPWSGGRGSDFLLILVSEDLTVDLEAFNK